MADVTLDPGAGGSVIHTKTRTGVETQIVGLDLTPAGGSETLMNGSIPVTDNGGSFTVDAPVGTPVFVRLSDGTSAIATLPVSLAALPATAADGAAGLPALTMVIAGFDGTNVQALVTDSTGRLILPPTTQAGATAKTADYDTGAGTDTVLMQGVALPASGGAVAGGTGTNPVRTDPTGTTTQPVSDAGGSLTVDGTVAVSGTVAVTDNAGSLTVDNGGTFAVQIAANSSVNVAQMAGTTTDTNSGNKSAGTQRVVLATDQPALTNALKVDGSAVTQPVSGTVTINAIPAGNNNIGDVDIASIAAGTNAIGKLAANSGVDIGDVDVTSISAGTNAIGNVGLIGRTTGGLTTSHIVSAASTNATVVKASAGQLFGWYIYNSNALARKVAFHNSASSPTAGASIFFTLVIPPTSAANVFSDIGIAFSSGIAVTMVTGLADSDSTGVAANDLICNLWYA